MPRWDVRLGTFNIHGLRGHPERRFRADIGASDGATAVALFARGLEALDCDVLAIQEGHPAIPRDIAPRMDVRTATFASPERWPGHLLSQGPIRSARPLAADGGAFSRSAGFAIVETPMVLRLLALHLHPKDERLRAAEAALVATELDRHAGDPIPLVVMGDFNCEPPGSIHRTLAERGFVNALTAAGPGLGATRDQAEGRARAVDHIYVDHTLAPHLTAATVVGWGAFDVDRTQGSGFAYSDHRPVVVELDPPHAGPGALLYRA